MKNIIAAFIVLIGAIEAYRQVGPPCHCDVIINAVKQRTLRMLAHPGSGSGSLARTNLSKLESCLKDAPAIVQNYMVAAANARILENNALAATLYEAALRYDRRPEIYFNLGLVQLDLRRTEEALRNLELACACNADLVGEIPYSDIRNVIAARVYAREMRIRAMIH
jgi:tetratricopeptide (TPR) repeat protein